MPFAEDRDSFNESTQHVTSLEDDESLRRRVETVLHENTHDEGFDFHCEGFGSARENGVICYYTGANRDARAQEFSRILFAQVDHPLGHFARLNETFSKLMECNFKPTQPMADVIERAYHRLRRLPPRPPRLVDAGSLSDVEYTHSGGSQTSMNPDWEDLQVVTEHNTNTIRIALFLEIIGIGAMARSVLSLVDTIAELLEAASLLATKVEPGLSQKKWFIVRAFLWTAWQRSTILLFSHLLHQDLYQGEKGDIRSDLVLRRTFPSPNLSIQEMSKRFSGLNKSKYMCSWAFELLRNDPISIGMDFRLFHRRYNDVFGNRSGRCIEGSDEPCDGKLPGHCQRFVGGAVQDQSAHDPGCLKTCNPMIWDEVSYRSVIGARAVSLDHTDPAGGLLRYCEASEKTLSISHVWSHGQGGRPESGLNGCLHRRYARIAISQGCDSYWMDTPCIPENHQLRNESIQKINEVFETSKLTLVCDRDLMEVDIEHVTLELRETILTIILVADWNVRAWTFLEAFKGRHAIFLLCKDNRIISLKETMEMVFHQGRLDLAVLFLTVPHLLPAAFGLKTFIPKPHKVQDIRWSKPGSILLENGGSLLSHRAASRPGDDIVIWSLVLNEPVCNSAEEFWRSRIDTKLHTGFLMSSTPRLSIPGFSWAPSRPTPKALSSTSHSEEAYYLAYDGADTDIGSIKDGGFSAFWLQHEFDGGKRKRVLLNLPKFSRTRSSSRLSNSPDNLSRIRNLYLQDYRYGVLLRPIQAIAFDTPADYRGNIDGILVAVCGSNNDEKSWIWRGVYEWDLKEVVPKFTRSENRLLIE